LLYRPCEEQRRIAARLDEQTAKNDPSVLTTGSPFIDLGTRT